MASLELLTLNASQAKLDEYTEALAAYFGHEGNEPKLNYVRAQLRNEARRRIHAHQKKEAGKDVPEPEL